MVVGVGIGGTFEKCALMAKEALTREVGSHSDIPYVKELEEGITGADQQDWNRTGRTRRNDHSSCSECQYISDTHRRTAGCSQHLLPCEPSYHQGGVSMDKHITAPITKETAKSLHAGDYVYVTGTIYTARDAAHKRMDEALDRGEELPIDIKNQAIYYMGPSPAREGRPIGSAGPTTASRMDKYAPRLLDLGQTAMIGKRQEKPGSDPMRWYVTDAYTLQPSEEPVHCYPNASNPQKSLHTKTSEPKPSVNYRSRTFRSS